MKVELKYQPGDTVWLMYQNRVREGRVTRSWYSRHTSRTDYESVGEYQRCFVSLDETGDGNYNNNIGSYEIVLLFPTKDELIKSL